MDQRRPIPSGGSVHPSSILVVEDEPLIRHITVGYLEGNGFSVLEATNAREAIGMLETATVKIDLVFSDIQMPGGLDGCDLARWVRENRPDLPVILTSGRVPDGALPDDLSQFAPIERKPYRPEPLLKRIRAAVDVK